MGTTGWGTREAWCIHLSRYLDIETHTGLCVLLDGCSLWLLQQETVPQHTHKAKIPPPTHSQHKTSCSVRAGVKKWSHKYFCVCVFERHKKQQNVLTVPSMAWRCVHVRYPTTLCSWWEVPTWTCRGAETNTTRCHSAALKRATSKPAKQALYVKHGR